MKRIVDIAGDFRFALSILAKILVLVLVSGEVGASQVMPASVLACLSIKEDVQRLICFDREVGLHRSLSVQNFGLSSEQTMRGMPAGREGAVEVNSVSARVTSIQVRADGKMAFALDNLQTWVQTNPENFGRVAVGDEVTIKSGMLGSYFLATLRKQATRVARLR